MSRLPDNPSLETNSKALRELADDVGRIASTLARLALPADDTTTARKDIPTDGRATSSPPIEAVWDMINARRLRFQYFDQKYFAEPAWDMLLKLFHAEISGVRVTVSSLCMAAMVPPTTALRWIQIMTDADMFRRNQDPHDARRVFIELSPLASQAMCNFFSKLSTRHPTLEL